MHTAIDLDKFISEHVTERAESLLSEDLKKYHDDLNRAIDGKSALVIGGAGTIGSSYIRALLKFRVKRLFVIDINENGLTELVRDLRSRNDVFVPEDLKTYPINFSDKVFEKILSNEGPFDIVANFAAHKHVRSEKDQYSIEAMIENNVLKAQRLLDILLKFPAERFFCVSTDKAANPVNIMGASKKLMEDVIMAYSEKMHITTARFANVAFSNGSLPLGFLERISKRQPLSCPLGIRRYFVSPEESGQICLIASILGESGDIFFPKLDMENDLKPFSDIAYALLKTLGLEPIRCSSEEEAKMVAQKSRINDSAYPIYLFDSDTTGEKAYEEFYTDKETLNMLLFARLGVIKKKQRRNISELQQDLEKIKVLFNKETISKGEIVALLKEYLPNFEHIEKGKNLDQRM